VSNRQLVNTTRQSSGTPRWSRGSKQTFQRCVLFCIGRDTARIGLPTWEKRNYGWRGFDSLSAFLRRPKKYLYSERAVRRVKNETCLTITHHINA
jgi:hypothetical protein